METSPHHRYQLLIREFHLDTLGHVNHATYLQILEEARWEWLSQYGLGLDYVLNKQISPVILEANIKYLRELRLRETITISSWVTQPKNKIFWIKQELHNAAGEAAATLQLTAGLMDLRLRKLIPLPPEWEILFNKQ